VERPGKRPLGIKVLGSLFLFPGILITVVTANDLFGNFGATIRTYLSNPVELVASVLFVGFIVLGIELLYYSRVAYVVALVLISLLLMTVAINLIASFTGRMNMDCFIRLLIVVVFLAATWYLVRKSTRALFFVRK
jgi:hypothetical protein